MTTTHATLVVSPDPGLVNQVQVAIEQAGLAVDVVVSAELALEWLAEQTPLLIVAEVDLPGFTGYELCRRVKGEIEGVLAFLLVHREGDMRAEEECAAAGSDGAIGRPFQVHQFQEQLQALLPDPLPPLPESADGDSPSVVVSIDDGSFESMNSQDGSLNGLGSLDSDSIRSVDTAELVAFRNAAAEGDVLGPDTGRPRQPDAFGPPDQSLSDGVSDGVSDAVTEAVARQFEALQAEGGPLDERIHRVVSDAVSAAIVSAAPDIAREVARIVREDGGD